MEGWFEAGLSDLRWGVDVGGVGRCSLGFSKDHDVIVYD